MNGKEIIALIVIAIVCANTYVYTRAILRKEIRPHVFTWVIWCLTQVIGASAQWTKGAGAGTWPMFFGSLICLLTAGLSLFYHGERNITRSDWAAFIATLVAIPIWLATDNPLSASLLVSAIDAVGMYPTFRKSWRKPYEENIFLFATATLNFALVVCAVESYSLTTTIYPASMILTHGALTAMLIWRRAAMRKNS
jgi:hypothetical protein